MTPGPRKGAPQRIVSLAASNTEIVCALGLGERLVNGLAELARLLHPEHTL